MRVHMGSASRPHRRARSAKVLYKDSASEDEDGENFSIAHHPIVPSDRIRKNLALKRVSRSQERAEALQIQKAIEESLSRDKEDVSAGRVSSDAAADGAKEVVDSEEEAPNVLGCIRIEAGLQYPCAGAPQEASETRSQEKVLKKQAAFDEIPIPSIEILHGDEGSSRRGIGVVNPRDIESSGTINADKKILKAVVEKDEDWSCEEGDDGDEEEDVTDDESSDASEDLKYKRKRPLNSQQKGRKAVGPTAKEQKPFTAQLKKPRSSRTVSEARAPMPAKKGLPSNGNAMKPSTQSKPADAKEKRLTSTTFEASKKHLSPFQSMNSKESKEYGSRGALLKGCKTTLVEHQKSLSATLFNKASLLDNASCESSGILGFPAQSPTGLHRRVIGLSRRFKPPPLHPYLPKMEGDG